MFTKRRAIVRQIETHLLNLSNLLVCLLTTAMWYCMTSYLASKYSLDLTTSVRSGKILDIDRLVDRQIEY
jgi:hypothetical protein